MLALSLMLSVTHYAQNYAGIIGRSLAPRPTNPLIFYRLECHMNYKLQLQKIFVYLPLFQLLNLSKG